MTSNSVYFTEDMHGFIEKVISPFDGEAQTFATIANEGEIKDQNFKFRLTLKILKILLMIKNLQQKPLVI